MKLADLPPTTRVRLHFVSQKDTTQTGSLDCTAEHAMNPNRSQRFFPPIGTTAAELGWPVPYWYAEECKHFELLLGR